MKKLFVLALLFVCAGALYAADTDYFSTGPNEEFRVMSSGIIFSTAGFAAQDFWQDVPSISSVCVRNDVAAREISTSTWWGSGITSGATTYTVKDIEQPVWPSNISGNVVSTATRCGGTAGIIDTFRSSATMTVYGTNAKGETINETVKISTGVSGWTLSAFATISSVTVTITSVTFGQASPETENKFLIYIGQGTRFGLKNNIEKKSDIYKVFESTGDVNVNKTIVDLDKDTIDFDNNPNGTRDYSVWYRAKRTK